MTNCRKYLDWATSPLGGLEPPKPVRLHLEACEPCRQKRDGLDADLRQVEQLLNRDAAATEVPEPFVADVMSSLGTPSWQLKRPRTWLAPVAAGVSLTTGSLALLHPLPAGLAESWAPLAALSRPLATFGEASRLAAASFETLGSQLGTAAGPVGALIAASGAVALLIGVRRLSRVAVSSRQGR